MELDETSRFWYSRVTLDAWIDFSSLTIELRPSKRRENLFFFLSLFLRLLPLYPILSSLFCSWLSSFFPFIYFLFWSYLIPPNRLFSICLLPSHFSHFFISPHFLVSFFSFFFSFGLHQPNGPKSGKLPPHFLLCHLSFSNFS